jgi:hypothetical protein
MLCLHRLSTQSSRWRHLADRHGGQSCSPGCWLWVSRRFYLPKRRTWRHSQFFSLRRSWTSSSSGLRSILIRCWRKF